MKNVFIALVLLGGVAFIIWRNSASEPSPLENHATQQQIDQTISSSDPNPDDGKEDSQLGDSNVQDQQDLEKTSSQIDSPLLSKKGTPKNQKKEASDQLNSPANDFSLPKSSRRLSSRQQRIFNLLKLRFDAQSGLYELNPSQKLFDSLAITLERLVEIQCFSDFSQTLEQTVPQEEPLCLALLKKLEYFSPNNLVGKCVTFGLNSPSCSEAYVIQTIGRPRNKQEDVTEEELNAKLSALKNEQALAELYDELDSALELKKDATKPEEIDSATTKVNDLYNQVIPLECSGIEIRIQRDKLESEYRLNHAFNRTPREKLSLDQIYSDFTKRPENRTNQKDEHGSEKEGKSRYEDNNFEPFSNTNSTNADPTRFDIGFRVRVLPGRCFKVIRDAIDQDPYSPTAICYFEGFSSPNCLKARKYAKLKQQHRLTQRNKDATHQNRQQQSQGLTTF